jgi:hypothetical protein
MTTTSLLNRVVHTFPFVTLGASPQSFSFDIAGQGIAKPLNPIRFTDITVIANSFLSHNPPNKSPTDSRHRYCLGNVGISRANE